MHRIGMASVAIVAACSGREIPHVEGSVTVQPATAALSVGRSQQFTALIDGASSTAVDWSVSESGGGSIDSAGLYTEPASTGTFHVVATSTADATKSGGAAITVSANASISVSVSPASPSIFACGSQTFTATVTGTSDTAVAWSVQEGASGGSITSAGVYTAPPTAGTYQVVATSHASPDKSGSAAIAVSTQVLSVSVSPDTVTLTTSAQQEFTATVTTSCGAFTSVRTLDQLRAQR